MAITAGRDRILLATLLLHAGRVVDHATLAEALWGIGPPPTARSQLQICVSRLRRRLPPGTIASDPAGYRFACDPADLDAAVFTRRVARARADGDAALYREALDLWRGEALAGIDSTPVRAGAAALDEHYAAAVEEWAELELAAGGERDLIGPLGAVVERFPLRERLRGQLIRALAGAGRSADALASGLAALRLRALHDDVSRSSTALQHLGLGYVRLGRYTEALRYGRRALLIAIEADDDGPIAIALIHIQKCKREAGLGSAAADRYLAAALRVARALGNRLVEAEALNEKAVVQHDRGRYDEAVALHEAAIAIIRQTSDRLYEVAFSLDLAITRSTAGDSAGALELYRRALGLAQAHGMAYLAARAEAGIAECLAGTDPEQAHRLRLVALAAFREMGVPEQYEVERRLAA